jgi:hypothetical protein
MWWKKRLDLIGAAFFRGALAPSLESLTSLQRSGCAVSPLAPASHESWAAQLTHPAWGQARLAAPRQAPALPAEQIEFGCGLTEGERKRLVRDARTPLSLELPARDEDVLRDRKRLLHFLAAVLGDDGVAGLDLLAQMIWTPERLADELAHAAPLDIIQVHVLHVVTQDAGLWLHSHGLGELGFVDFDVLRPAEAITGEQFDVLRALAYAIVEGATSGPISPVLGADPIALVPAATFMRAAAPADCALRDAEGHTERRVVCCDGNAPGFLGRLFGARDTRPSRLLSRGLIEGRQLIQLSNTATELTACRARESLGLFGKLCEEFAELKCTPVVKLGYPVDDASGPTDREHLWFEVHGVRGDAIDATLLNDPFAVAALKAGVRAQHPAELLTDWTLMTPLGQLTPRSLEVARKLREVRPQILEALASAPT